MKGKKRNWKGERIVADVTLRKSEIPAYLRQGELYRTLMENNDDLNEKVTFPSDVLKPKIQIDSMADCDYLLNSLRFWGVDGIGTKEIIAFVLNCDETRNRIDAFLQKYETEFQLLYWLRKIMWTRPCDRSRVAIQSGMIELVEPVFVSVHINKNHRIPADACDLAAEVGNLEVMTYLHKNGCRINFVTCSQAVRNGHTSIVQFLYQHGYKFTCYDLITAIESDQLKCVQIMCSYMALDCKDETGYCGTAAQCGHLEILQYLHSTGFAWEDNTTDYAAWGGHLHCLQYLHEQGCEWTSSTCNFAARNGHLHCLRYAHQHGATFNNYVVDAAVEVGHLDCLQYAHEQGCVWTYMETRSSTRVLFMLNGTAVQRHRTQYCSPLLWDYLRTHATNT